MPKVIPLAFFKSTHTGLSICYTSRMNIIHGLVLSLVEGITEFLPISSTGHLIITSQLLGIAQTEFIKSFEIAIQLGAVLAIVAFYWKTLVRDMRVWTRIIAAFIPTGVLGLLLYSFVKAHLLGNMTVVVWALLLGGVVMLVVEYVVERKAVKQVETTIADLSYPRAILIGAIQGISIIPGVSRAMATIFGGLGVGLTRKTATEFSFLLAIPTMLAATGLDLLKTSATFTSQEFVALAVGFMGAFLAALIAVKYLIGFVQHHSFRVFAWYRIAVAIVLLALL
ncbi:MAG: Undecaprenyl-diphosphatase [Parcubacteria group bacterium GW2011_GWA2_47_7]|nr:MAG: Undecaprenyl-diphosphatase [Parcubacteria group bacterium GW2011_GWA2_47_7]